MSTHLFEIEGIRFELRTLKVDDACSGMDLMNADDSMAKMSKLLKLFAPYCKVSRNGDGTFEGGALMVPLKDFADDLFGGRLDLLIRFNTEAVNLEYGSFLGKAGVALPSAAALTKP